MLSNLQDQRPLLKEFCLPDSGHPPGYIYGWVSNDDRKLYVALDVTSDNTMDGDKDYAKVNIKTDDGVKVFKISVSEMDWGIASFVYTDKAIYQHKAYEFVIPLSEIGINDNNLVKDIPIAFTAYGTMSSPLQFNPLTSGVIEDAGFETITIVRSNANEIPYPGNVTVGYSTIDDSAIAGQDYQAVSGTFEFTLGVTSTSFQIPIMNDLLYEEGEGIGLRLFIVGSEYNYSVSNGYLAIRDEPGQFEFSNPMYSVAEAAGTAEITVNYTGDYRCPELLPTLLSDEEPQVIAGINYETSDVSATAPSDYTAVSDVLEFLMGENTKTFTVTINEDSTDEIDETVKLSLFNMDTKVGNHFNLMK